MEPVAREPSRESSSTSRVASPARIDRLFSLKVDAWMIELRSESKTES